MNLTKLIGLFLCAMAVIVPVRILDLMICGFVAGFLNWLGSSWHWIDQDYKPQPGLLVAALILVYVMYQIDKLRAEMSSERQSRVQKSHTGS
jgi:hypothetical protein